MGRLEGQVAIVTGGGRGIGREICVAIAAEGASVAVMSRTEAQVDGTTQVIEAAGGTAMAAVADVTNLTEVQAVLRRIEASLGPTDILVNNAGSNTVPGLLVEADPAKWWRDVTINLLGPFHMCRSVLPGMLQRGQGRIINMMGAGTADTYAYLSAYGSSKAALMRLTETLDLEVCGSGISVFALDPGLVRTAMNEAHLQSGAYERLFPSVVDAFEQGLDSSPAMAALLAVEIASGRLDELHGRWLGAQEDLEQVLTEKDRILAQDLKTLRLREIT